MNPQEAAKEVHRLYLEGCEFPSWVLEEEMWEFHDFASTKVFYHKEDSLEDVKELMTKREPCNIGTRRLYDGEKMKATFGYEKGGYMKSTKEKLMPNISVYCHATIKPMRAIPEFSKAHVLNLIGYAFDSPRQPDYQYFDGKPVEELVQAYGKMWEHVVTCVKEVPAIKSVVLYNVGGGAFAGKYGYKFAETIFEPAFTPTKEKLEEMGICVKGYDWETRRFNGGYIPFVLTEEDLWTTLWINAWDPWSLIGNGNEQDNSLDGSWGRISNMAILGWRFTNPSLKFVGF